MSALGFDMNAVLAGMPEGTKGEVWYEHNNYRTVCRVTEPHPDAGVLVYTLTVSDREAREMHPVKLHVLFGAMLDRAEPVLMYDVPRSELPAASRALPPASHGSEKA